MPHFPNFYSEELKKRHEESFKFFREMTSKSEITNNELKEQLDRIEAKLDALNVHQGIKYRLLTDANIWISL